MLIRIFFGTNACYFVYALVIREELIANGALPIFNITFGNTGCLFCRVVNKSMRNLIRFFAFFNDCFAALAAGIAGISILGAGGVLLIFQLGSANMLIRIFFGTNACYFVYALIIREELLANGALPIFNIAFGNTGCLFCRVMNKIVTLCRNYNDFFLLCKSGILKACGIFYLAVFGAGCVFCNFCSIYGFRLGLIGMERTAAGCGASAVIAVPGITRFAPAMLFLYLNLDSKVGHNTIFYRFINCIKVC